MKQYFFLTAAWLLLSQCHKKADPEPLAQLPPATQTGANTFGCLVNGQALLPKGNDGTANYDVVYDPTFNGGNLGVSAYHITSKAKQYIILGGDRISRPGTYLLSPALDTDAYFADDEKAPPCAVYDSDTPSTYCRGTLTITRLDLTAGIVAGTFAFTLAKPGCDTIKVTEGRFDSKL